MTHCVRTHLNRPICFIWLLETSKKYKFLGTSKLSETHEYYLCVCTSRQLSLFFNEFMHFYILSFFISRTFLQNNVYWGLWLIFHFLHTQKLPPSLGWKWNLEGHQWHLILWLIGHPYPSFSLPFIYSSICAHQLRFLNPVTVFDVSIIPQPDVAIPRAGNLALSSPFMPSLPWWFYSPCWYYVTCYRWLPYLHP